MVRPSRSADLAVPSTPYLPSFSFHERHDSAPIAADAEAIIQAVASIDFRAVPVIDRLMLIREAPARLLRRLGDKPAGETPAFGLHSFTPLSRSETEINFGLAGRFWRLDYALARLRDAEDFARYAEAGAARLVLRYQVLPAAAGRHILRTETFVQCPDLRAKALFTPYWLAIRLASGWIRRRTLLAVERALTA
ncbi:hypothetical protein GRF61_22340 [Azoarcus sp. TTM-91]|nr:hypothetical protein [Azoarcus sp. TTM-91]